MVASRAPEHYIPRDVARPQAATRLTADTSSQSEGITRRVMLNVFEAFFRRPILHLIPLVLMICVGIAAVLSAKSEYRSVGTFSVNESLLADLTDEDQGAGFTFDSPATVTADQINELLRTDQFLNDVATGVGVLPQLENGTLTRAQLRSWTSAAADGESIVRISASTNDPELSYRLADATLDSYRAWLTDADVSQSTSTEASLEARVAEKQAAVDAADAAIRAKILEQPEVEMEDRAPVDQEDYTRLQGIAERAREQLVIAQDSLDTARSQTDQASAIVAQKIRVLDEPAPAAAAEGRLRAAALTMALFVSLGVVLMVVSVVVTATLDRTVRVPEDITARFGVDVLAVVPDTSR